MLNIDILTLEKALSKKDSSEIEILFGGDLCPILDANVFFQNSDGKTIYGNFIELLKNKDLSIVNLECPLTTHNEKKIKTGPNLKTEPGTIKGINAGFFDICNIGNNHIMDYCDKGLYDTVNICKKNGIVPLGYTESANQPQNIYFKSLNGFRIAILSYAEGEFSKADIDSSGANPLDLIDIYHDIREARSNADFIIVLLHAGNEQYHLPNPLLKKISNFIIDLGADVLVGTHSHFPGVYEIYKSHAIFYSLGNFIFPDIKEYNLKSDWTLGYFLQLRINVKEKKIKYNIIPFRQSMEPPLIKQLNVNEFNSFKEKMKSLNKIVRNDELLLKEWKGYCNKIKNNFFINLIVPSMFHPIIYRIIHRLNIPFKKFRSKRMLVFDAYMNCLSAQEAMRTILKDFNKR